MRYASVCSGVEAESLAWMPLGWQAAWFSEIEPFPCAVLKHRFPDVPNLGDMTKIHYDKEKELTYVDGAADVVSGRIDLLVGGTPCQSFSVAGKRQGLQGASGLAYHFVRLLQEIQPRWFVWENVPGALSSKHSGFYEFNFLLTAYAECGYSLCWRILDAQYVRVDGYPRAVPQRRRRVFVVGHLGADVESAAKVLFEPKSMLGDTPPRRIKGKGFTADTESGADEASRMSGLAEHDGCGDKGFCGRYDTAKGKTQSPGKSAGTGRPFDGLEESGTGETGRPWDESGVNPTLNQANAGSGAIVASNQELFSQNANGLVMDVNSPKNDVSATLTTYNANATSPGGWQGVDCYNQRITGDVAMTMNAAASDYDHVPVVIE